MLVANMSGRRTEAACAKRGEQFQCPSCQSEVILKRGQIVIAHFAHRAGAKCAWAKGESRQHLESKQTAVEALRCRGLQAEVEYYVGSLFGDRRADVMTWSPKGQAVAIEMQNSNIGLDLLYSRAKSYVEAGIAQIWIPFIREKILEGAIVREDDSLVIEKYSPRPFEKKIYYDLFGRVIWMYDANRKKIWRCKMEDFYLWMSGSEYRDENGDEIFREGGYYKSKRWVKLVLEKPYCFDDVKLVVRNIENFDRERVNFWPIGKYAEFVVP